MCLRKAVVPRWVLDFPRLSFFWYRLQMASLLSEADTQKKCYTAELCDDGILVVATACVDWLPIWLTPGADACCLTVPLAPCDKLPLLPTRLFLLSVSPSDFSPSFSLLAGTHVASTDTSSSPTPIPLSDTSRKEAAAGTTSSSLQVNLRKNLKKAQLNAPLPENPMGKLKHIYLIFLDAKIARATSWKAQSIPFYLNLVQKIFNVKTIKHNTRKQLSRDYN
ncbi:uncharacterized protein LOC130290249 isoform X2 [Hyla sarda]|uniref:uncharacterized protein LOC130290249 isoform X2 n=1 Tax=Hyla sarda TaxID=327740 RepID=UPI0024C2F40B|nr:uncharacterized protein LOC130290249 isoform X2 [Hyla sarda]